MSQTLNRQYLDFSIRNIGLVNGYIFIPTSTVDVAGSFAVADGNHDITGYTTSGSGTSVSGDFTASTVGGVIGTVPFSVVGGSGFQPGDTIIITELDGVPATINAEVTVVTVVTTDTGSQPTTDVVYSPDGSTWSVHSPQEFEDEAVGFIKTDPVSGKTWAFTHFIKSIYFADVTSTTTHRCRFQEVTSLSPLTFGPATTLTDLSGDDCYMPQTIDVASDGHFWIATETGSLGGGAGTRKIIKWNADTATTVEELPLNFNNDAYNEMHITEVDGVPTYLYTSNTTQGIGRVDITSGVEWRSLDTGDLEFDSNEDLRVKGLTDSSDNNLPITSITSGEFLYFDGANITSQAQSIPDHVPTHFIGSDAEMQAAFPFDATYYNIPSGSVIWFTESFTLSRTIRVQSGFAVTLLGASGNSYASYNSSVGDTLLQRSSGDIVRNEGGWLQIENISLIAGAPNAAIESTTGSSRFRIRNVSLRSSTSFAYTLQGTFGYIDAENLHTGSGIIDIIFEGAIHAGFRNCRLGTSNGFDMTIEDGGTTSYSEVYFENCVLQTGGTGGAPNSPPINIIGSVDSGGDFHLKKLSFVNCFFPRPSGSPPDPVIYVDVQGTSNSIETLVFDTCTVRTSSTIGHEWLYFSNPDMASQVYITNNVMSGAGTSFTAIANVTDPHLRDGWIVKDNFEEQVLVASTPEKYFGADITGATTLADPLARHAVHKITSDTVFTVNLPASPTNGAKITIKDTTGNASVNNKTIDGNGNGVEGGGSTLLEDDYGAIQLTYDGGTWWPTGGGSGGGGGDLATTLGLGNTTGGTSISVTTGDDIVGAAELDLVATTAATLSGTSVTLNAGAALSWPTADAATANDVMVSDAAGTLSIANPSVLTFIESGTITKPAPQDVGDLSNVVDTTTDTHSVTLSDGDGLYLTTISVIGIDESSNLYHAHRQLTVRRSGGAVLIDDENDVYISGTDMVVFYTDEGSNQLGINVSNNIGTAEDLNARISTGWIYIPIPTAP